MKKQPALFLALALAVLLSACNSLPKQAKYIPGDAALVIGLNTGGISKKVAWSAITGSKILDDLKESAKNDKGVEAMREIEQSGIDFNSTIYFYVKPDKRYDNDVRMTLVAPLEDAAKWVAYLKKVYPASAIAKVKDRSEARIGNKAYAAWNGSVLMISNLAMLKNEVAATGDIPDIAVDTTSTVVASADDASTSDSAITDIAAMDIGASDVTSDTAASMVDLSTTATPAAADYTVMEAKPDAATTMAEMDAAFALKEDASITENKRFKKLQDDGHDISIFVAYGSLMDSYAAKADMGMMGSMMGGTIWKNSAMATGIDFEKGKVTGILQYYPSDSMREVAKVFGADNIDKDLLSRVSAENLDMIAGYHLSPKATKLMLDKLNLSGMANLFLMQQGLTVDEILNAFTGDIVVAINNLGTKPAPVPADSMMPASGGPNMDFVYAMKLNSKESFNKMFAFVTKEGMLQQTAPNTYSMPGAPNISLGVSDKYIAVSNVAANAQAFLQKNGGRVPDVADQEIVGHPVGAFVDIALIMKSNSAMMDAATGADTAVMGQFRSMFSNGAFNGGEFKGEANEYHMSLNLVNKEENSLLQFIQMAQRFAQAKKAGTVAINH